jgi:NOL1/NOP2/sun family putative RNA methylase
VKKPNRRHEIFDCYRDIIPEFNAFQEIIRQPLPVHLRVNRLKIEPDLLRKMFEEQAISVESTVAWDDSLLVAPGLESPGNLLEYYLGYIHPQALTSCLVPWVLSPRSDTFLLDMCASPGGKTAHLAQWMNNTGLIIANDLYPSRHIPLVHTLTRLGVLNTVVTSYQAQEFPLKEGFDYVLADVPCSGEGRFRMRWEGDTYRMSQGRERLSEIQKKIILRGFDLLKPGGQILYSTCTYNPEENEGVVEHLLKNRDAKLLPIRLDLHCDSGLLEWNKKIYGEQLQRAIRLYPHRNDSVGFFMALVGRDG